MAKTSLTQNKDGANLGRSFWHDAFIRFKRKKFAMLGFWMLVFIVAVCIYGFLFLDYETQVINQNLPMRLQGPSMDHPFGTDNFGRDILARIVYGSRYSLFIGFTSTFISILLGVIIGSVAGYFGGKTDNILMRFMDIQIAIPSTLLAIAVVSALGPSLINLIVAISIADIPNYARIIRSSVLTVKDNEFVEAAVAVGSSHRRTIFTHILPNTLAPLIVQATLGVGYVIIVAAGLSYLGLGIMPPAPEWGNMLSEGQEVIRHSPWLVLFPGLSIMITVLALNLLGDGLRDSIDPKLKN